MLLDLVPVAEAIVNKGLLGRTAGPGTIAEEATAYVWRRKGPGAGHSSV